jgi:hypothetical protein
MSELVSIGCNHDDFTCSLPWSYSTIYWSGAAFGDNSIWSVLKLGEEAGIDQINYDDNSFAGARPVIKVSKSYFYD